MKTGSENKSHDLFEIEYTSEHVCSIAVKDPILATGPDAATGAICGLLYDLYNGPIKLVKFERNGKDFYASDGREDFGVTRNSIIGNKQVELLLDLLVRAPYFSVFLANGRIEDLGADIAVGCDWRFASRASQFCFVSRRNIEDVKSASRLAELIGGFGAFDSILRRRSISAEEAVRIGLAMPEFQEEDTVGIIENYAKDAKKESIAIMRSAVRNSFSNDDSIERIVSSISVAS